MTQTQRFVYVARLNTGDEVELRRILEHLPNDALAESDIEEFSSYVGSGFCVLQFALPEGDFQEQFERFANDPRVSNFFQKVSGHLIEGEQIAKSFSPGGSRFHQSTHVPVRGSSSVTSAQLPLAAEVSRWPHP